MCGGQIHHNKALARAIASAGNHCAIGARLTEFVDRA